VLFDAVPMTFSKPQDFMFDCILKKLQKELQSNTQNEPCLILDHLLIDQRLVGINHHIYLFHVFNSPYVIICNLKDKTWRSST
jgi:hypothetical protein